MFRINNGNIIITKGDNATFSVVLMQDNGSDGEPYLLVTGDEIKMTVKKAGTAVITKTGTFTVSTNIGNFELLPADTTSLTQGNYSYDVQVKRATDTAGTYEIYTVVPVHRFEIKEEVSS